MKESFLFLLLAGFCMPWSVHAGELKIVDAHGLTRALKVIARPVTVIVSPSDPSIKSAIELLHTDSFTQDIKEPARENGQFVFREVGEGAWQIKAPPGVVIRSVEIRQ